MWGVNPKVMCDSHLISEHSEIHLLVKRMREENEGKAVHKLYIKEDLYNLSDLKNRHDTIVEEMKRRGFKHTSPININFEIKRKSSINFEKAYNDLACQCKECKTRMAKYWFCHSQLITA